MNFINKYQFQLISISILALIIGLLFNKPLTGEYTFGGPDSMSPSAVHQGITEAEEEHGQYPLWLPWIFSGLPSVHSFQNISDYYFPNVITDILIFMGIPGFWNYVFHFILAGMGVIVILRRLGASRYSALFGGLSFSLMPYLITMVVHGHGSQMMTTAWLPWVIWAMLRLYDETNIQTLGILGLIVGLQMQRAHAQIVYYSWMAVGLLISMLLFKSYDKLRNNPKWIIYAGFAFILGFCMAMWIYLPAINYTPYSIRGAGSGGGTGFDYATSWSFSFAEMATFFIPSFYGFGGGTYWGNMPFTDYPNYMGIIVLTLSIIGIIYHNGKIKWYFVITALMALLLSFGKNFFIYQIFYDYLPYFNKFRVPVMLLILTQFSVSVLAGLGLDVATKWITDYKNNEMVKKLVWVCGTVLIIIIGLKFTMGNNPNFGSRSNPVLNSLRLEMINIDITKSILFIILSGSAFYITMIGWISRHTLAVIIISLSVIDMAWVDRQIIEPNRISYRQPTMMKKAYHSSYLQTDEVIRFLKEDATQFRILPLGTLRNENRWSAFQIESIDGYHPAKIYRYNQVKDEVGWHSLGVLKMLNVKYIVSLEDLSHPAFDKVFYGKLFHKGKSENANVYQFRYYMPRAFFVDKLQNISENDLQLQTLRKNDFNPLTLSYVEHDPEDIEYSSDATIDIIHWTPDKIEFQLDVPSRQFMVTSEIFYPGGWKITSHPDWEIHPVNTILRGIYIPIGSHKMVMEFIPDDIFYGSILTYGSSAVIILLILSGIFIRRKETAG